MHACATCHKTCDCGGDAARVIAIRAPHSCTHCQPRCAHRLAIDEFCPACEAEGFRPEENAPRRPQLNGGW